MKVSKRLFPVVRIEDGRIARRCVRIVPDDPAGPLNIQVRRLCKYRLAMARQDTEYPQVTLCQILQIDPGTKRKHWMDLENVSPAMMGRE